MPNFFVTQAKINELLKELRSWAPLEQRATLNELAERFQLDLFVVDRIARSEGLKIKAGYRPEEQDNEVDPEASTLDLDPAEIQEALDKPDPSPEYIEDVDTGVWKKKPTGEWELLEADQKKSTSSDD